MGHLCGAGREQGGAYRWGRHLGGSRLCLDPVEMDRNINPQKYMNCRAVFFSGFPSRVVSTLVQMLRG